MKHFFLLICLLQISCRLYEPLQKRNVKRNNSKLIRTTLDLSKDEYNRIKRKDTLIYELSLSIKEEVKSKSIERRLDSLFLGNYSCKMTIIALQMERLLKKRGGTFEFTHDTINTKGWPEFNDAEKLGRHLNLVDSSFKKKFKVKTIDKSKKGDSVKHY